LMPSQKWVALLSSLLIIWTIPSLNRCSNNYLLRHTWIGIIVPFRI